MTGQFYSLRLDRSQSREILERERESLKRGGGGGGGGDGGRKLFPSQPLRPRLLRSLFLSRFFFLICLR